MGVTEGSACRAPKVTPTHGGAMAIKDKLSSVSVEAARPRKKPYKLSDGGGLYLLINPDGSRWWRLKYRVDGREKLLSLGIYPAKSLKVRDFL